MATSFVDTRQGFDTSGRFIPTSRFRKLDVNAYVEFGLTDDLTAVIKPSITRASVSSVGDAIAAGSSGSQAGLRLHLATFGQLTFSLEATGVLPDADLWHGSGAIDPERGGAEVRGLAGYAFSLGRWPAFVDAEVGYRYHAGAAPDEARGDLSVGTRPRADILLLFQSFNIVTIGRRRPPFAPFRQHKAEVSIVYDLTPKWSAQVGLLLTPAGANAPAEMGATAAVWRRF